MGQACLLTSCSGHAFVLAPPTACREEIDLAELRRILVPPGPLGPPPPPPPSQQQQQGAAAQPVPPAGSANEGGSFREAGGWFRRSLTATACQNDHVKLGLPGGCEPGLQFQAPGLHAGADWQMLPPCHNPAAQLFELLTGQAGASSGTLTAFDPDLRKSYSIPWKQDSGGGNLHVRSTGVAGLA